MKWGGIKVKNYKNKIIHKENKKSKVKKTIIIVIIILIAILIISKIFIKNSIKNTKIGNNSSSQEIVEYFLNISSYEATIDMTVYSNKNENKYKIKQNYQGENNNCQEILEPSNIAGIKIIREENKLTLQNSKLNLINILENYQYITDNCIDLTTFIKDYKNDQTSKMKEENETIILETTSQSQNKYTKYKVLKIDKKTGNPLQMEIKADNQKTTIYILYNEVKISSN